MPATPSTFIVNLESEEPDEGLLERLERAGLAVDREYGLVKLDPRGHRRVARVTATERQLEAVQDELGATFYPDLTLFKGTTREE